MQTVWISHSFYRNDRLTKKAEYGDVGVSIRARAVVLVRHN